MQPVQFWLIAENTKTTSASTGTYHQFTISPWFWEAIGAVLRPSLQARAPDWYFFSHYVMPNDPPATDGAANHRFPDNFFRFLKLRCQFTDTADFLAFHASLASNSATAGFLTYPPRGAAPSHFDVGKEFGPPRFGTPTNPQADQARTNLVVRALHGHCDLIVSLATNTPSGWAPELNTDPNSPLGSLLQSLYHMYRAADEVPLLAKLPDGMLGPLRF